MLRVIYEHMAEGKMKTVLDDICAALKRVRRHYDAKAEVFGKMDNRVFRNANICGDGFHCFHLAVVTRTSTGAVRAGLKNAGWFRLGTVSGPPRIKVRKLRSRGEEYWSFDIWAFVYNNWVPNLRSGSIRLDVSAPAQLWNVVTHFEDDIMEQAEDGWATLAAGGCSVHYSYVQALPDGEA